MSRNQVLVIHHSRVIRTRIREMLPRGNFNIMEAKDGQQGLTYLRNFYPEIALIFLDFLLPIVSGWEIYQEIQSNPEMKTIPLLIMSGQIQEITDKIPEPFNTFEFLGEPFDKKELAAAIKAAFAKAQLFKKNSQNLASSNTQQPRKYDAVLGGNNSPPLNAAVLGGFEGMKRRFNSSEKRSRLQAIAEAPKYGDAGLEVLIAALKDESEKVKVAAYLLLKNREETKAIQALKKFNPWELFEPLYKFQKVHQDRVSAVALTPDGKTLISGGQDSTIKIWNLDTGELLRTQGERLNMVNSLAVAPEGNVFVSASNDRTIKIWNLHTGELIRTLTGHQGWVHSLVISCDGSTIVSGSSDRTIKVWNFRTGELIRTLVGHSYSIFALSLSFGGATLVSGSNDRAIKVWNLHTGELTRTLLGHRAWVNSVASSRDGGTIISCSSDGTIKTWDLHTGQLIRSIFDRSPFDPTPVFALAIAPDNATTIAGGGDGSIRIRNWRTGEVIRTLISHSDPIYSLSLSNDGSTLASGSNQGNIAVWGLRT